MSVENTTSVTLAMLLRARQLELRLKQREAAEQCGVTPSVYSRWISDLTLPSIGNIQGVAAFLGLDRGAVMALLPDSYQVRSHTAAEIEGLRDELALMRKNSDDVVEQLRDIRAVVEQLADVIERFKQND